MKACPNPIAGSNASSLRTWLNPFGKDNIPGADLILCYCQPIISYCKRRIENMMIQKDESGKTSGHGNSPIMYYYQHGGQLKHGRAMDEGPAEKSTSASWPRSTLEAHGLFVLYTNKAEPFERHFEGHSEGHPEGHPEGRPEESPVHRSDSHYTCLFV